MLTPPPPSGPLFDLSDLGEPALAFVVVGNPAPQGSKKAVGRTKAGRVILAESSKKVKPWRAAVAAAAIEAAQRDGRRYVPLDGPLVADMVFSLAKPMSAPKTLRVLPTTYPDESKLMRSTEDGLDRDANVIANDSKIVECRRLAKVYVGDTVDPDALPHPGAVIRLWHYPAHLLGRLDVAVPA